MLDERRLSVLIRQHGIGKPKDDAAPAKLLAAFLTKAEESKLGRILGRKPGLRSTSTPRPRPTPPTLSASSTSSTRPSHST